MKSRSRTGCIIGMALAVCLGLCFSAAGQAEKPDQNAPPLLPELEVDSQDIPSELKIEDPDPVLPPELEAYLKAQHVDFPPEVKGEEIEPPSLAKEQAAAIEQPGQNTPPLLPSAEELPFPPPELQELAGEDAPLELPQEEAPPPEAEKPAAAQAKVITDPAAMPTADISLFSHTFHVEKAGFKCTDCHNSIFQEIAGSAKAKGDFNMAAFGQGKYCGTCHDGSTAFAVTEQGSCVRCHGTDMELPQSK
jgi:c(7)-type cytochrome triheme protein